MYTFIDVTKDNFEEVIAIKTKDDQKDFLMSNLYSMAQAKVYNYLIPKAIYFNDELIGFVLYNYIDETKTSIFLKRYMIDEHYQGLKHGKSALNAFNDYIKKELNVDFIELMHYSDNKIAAKLYENAGYKATGEIRETEIVRRYYY